LNLVKVLVPTALVAVALAVLCTIPSKFAATLVNSLISYASKAPSTVLKLLISNPVSVLLLSIALTVALFLLIVNIFEVATLFILPSRELSIKALTSPKAINVVIDAPLRTIKTLILASLLAPPIYAALTRVIIPYLSVQLPLLYAFISSRIGAAILAIVVFLISALLVRPMMMSVGINPERAFAASLIVAGMIYASGVVASFMATGSVRYSLLHPDLKVVGSAMASIYVGFYAQFFYILEDLLRMLGVAP